MDIDVDTISRLMPELILVLFATCVFVGGTVVRSKIVWTPLAIVVLFVSLILVHRQETADLAGGPILADLLARGFRLCSLLMGILYLLFLTQSRQSKLYPELVGSLIMLIAGLMVISSAADLLILFLGFELVSIPTYVLLFVASPGRSTNEASAKYFFLSILSSALMLYGFATIYGISGEIELAAIQQGLRGANGLMFGPMLPVALVMILAGLAFKISAFPFQFYAPDVFQGTTYFNAAVLAVVPKIAGVVGIIRVLVTTFPRESSVPWQLVIVMAVVTMTVGNFSALWQSNLKRLMAYSSIAHAGYLLIGLAAAFGADIGSRQGASASAAMIFYVMVYAAGTIGTFAALAYLSDDDRSFSRVDDLAGIGRGYPVIAACLAVCMFSLAGIPPLAGFWGKLTLFKSALDAGFVGPDSPRAWFVTLSVIGVLNAAVAAAYYLRVIATMYFRNSIDHSVMPVMGNMGAGVAALASVVVVIGVGLFTGPSMLHAESAARSAWYISTESQASSQHLNERPSTQRDDIAIR